MSKPKMTETKKKEVTKEFMDTIGEENFSANPAVCAAYRGCNYNIIRPWGSGPEFVVLPKMVEHVQAAVKIAGKHGLTITAIGCGTITSIWEADIVIDMMGMKKIHKIDTRNSYVVVEAGVTYTELLPLLRKEGYTIAYGSFPPSFSPMTNLGARRGWNNNFVARIADQSLGIEVVLPDATIVRTSIATYGVDYWSCLAADMPDIKGLFTPISQGYPNLGIVTKAALRIWPMLDARGLPIAGFDSLGKALEYSLAVCKAGIADQSMCWNWIMVAMAEARLGKPQDELDFLNYTLKPDTDYTKPYKNMSCFYCYNQFRGYREQVDTNIAICKRLAREKGGKVFEDEELQATIPRTWQSWKSTLMDFKPGFSLMTKGVGSGVHDVWYYLGKVDDIVRLEKAATPRLKEKYNWHLVPLYTRTFEYGVGAHLRYSPSVDIADDKEAEYAMRVRDEMNKWVLDNFPEIHCPGGGRVLMRDSMGVNHLLEKIRATLDPNHTYYYPGDKRLDEEDGQ